MRAQRLRELLIAQGTRPLNIPLHLMRPDRRLDERRIQRIDVPRTGDGKTPPVRGEHPQRGDKGMQALARDDIPDEENPQRPVLRAPERDLLLRGSRPEPVPARPRDNARRLGPAQRFDRAARGRGVEDECIDAPKVCPLHRDVPAAAEPRVALGGPEVMNDGDERHAGFCAQLAIERCQ